MTPSGKQVPPAQATPTQPCPAGTIPDIGSVADGPPWPCVPGKPVATPNDPWEVPNYGDRECPPGYNLHLYNNATPWCANGALDRDPSNLGESPWETNRSDFVPNSFDLFCGSSNTTGCMYQNPTPWQAANKYYLCCDEGGSNCNPPAYAPVIGPKVPGDDPEHPAHGFQMFPYGKPQEDAYNEILDHLEQTEHGIYDMIEANQQLRERLDDWAMAQVSTPAWVEANDPPADGEPVEPPGEGEGDGEAP